MSMYKAHLEDLRQQIRIQRETGSTRREMLDYEEISQEIKKIMENEKNLNKSYNGVNDWVPYFSDTNGDEHEKDTKKWQGKNFDVLRQNTSGFVDRENKVNMFMKYVNKPSSGMKAKDGYVWLLVFPESNGMVLKLVYASHKEGGRIEVGGK